MNTLSTGFASRVAISFFGGNLLEDWPTWIGYDMKQIKLTEYKTMHQNANIGGTCMLATQVCVWRS